MKSLLERMQDFFQISVQRQAANAAALMLSAVPPEVQLAFHLRVFM